MQQQAMQKGKESLAETGAGNNSTNALAQTLFGFRIKIRAMSPVLLEGPDIFKFGLVFSIFGAAIFSTGFMLGYDKAESGLSASKQREALPLPGTSEVAASALEPRIPDVIAVGADIDVDQPDPESQAATESTGKNAGKDTGDNAAVNAGEDTVDSIGKSLARKEDSDRDESSRNEQLQVTGKAISPEQVESTEISRQTLAQLGAGEAARPEHAGAEQPAVGMAEPNSRSGSDSGSNPGSGSHHGKANIAVMPPVAEMAKARYTIQVGMYGNIINADNMVSLLQAQNMQAYLSEYYNRKNELRYNVRFGFFANKREALAALEQYKSEHNGDGYLLRFSAESLARLTAERESAEVMEQQPAETASQGDSTS